MKSKTIRKLKNISSKLQQFLINKNDLCVERSRKNNILDVILYKLFYTQFSSTQEKATIILNKFKHKDNKSSRQSLVKKEKNLDLEFYKKLSIFLSDQIDNDIFSKYTHQIIAVDGTFPTLLDTLEKDGFKTNMKGTSVTPLVSGLF